MRKVIIVLLVAVLSVAVASCNFFGTGSGNVALGVTGNPQEAFPNRSISARSISTDIGDASIEVTKVEMVLFAVSMTVADSMDAEDFDFGPFLLDLPLGVNTEALVDGFILPPGTYDALEVEVKIPEGHEDQAAFEAEYPDWDTSKSVRVVGTYDGSGLIDPGSVDLEGPDAAQIEANIENSFEAFEDL